MLLLYRWRPMYSAAKVRDINVYQKSGRTPSRYLSCPSRSKYLRHQGNVPKFFLMTLSKVLADDTLRAAFGASGFRA